MTELDRCREALADLRESQAEREAGQRRERGEALFAAGEPQPGAERRLGPLFVAQLGRQYGRPVAQTLVCRTWVCRLVITVGGPEAPEFPEHLEDIVARRSNDGPETMLPAPASAEVCRAHLADLQQREKDERDRDRQAQARRDPTIAYQMGKPSPALTEQTARHLRTAFGLPAEPTERLVVCRETICRLLVPLEGDRFRKLRAGAIGYRYEWDARQEAGQPVNYLWWRTEAYGNSRRLLAEAAQSVEAARTRCAGREPRRGGLVVRVQLPVSAASAPPTPVLTGEGSLVGTPLGQCMTALVAEKIGASTVRGPFARSSRNMELLFPAAP